LRVNKAAIGLIITAYTLPAVFLTPGAGLLADLWGRRPVLFLGMLVFGISGAAIGLAPNFGWVLALRVIQGTGAAAITPLTIVLLSDLVRDEQETSAQGAKVVLDRVGLAVLPVIGGFLALHSWRLAFMIYGLAVPLAVLGLVWLAETRPAAPLRTMDYLRGFFVIGRRPQLLVAFSAGFLRFFLDYGYFTYLPFFLALAYHSSPATVGLLLACFAAGAMLTASQAGRLVRRRDPTQLLVLGFLIAGISLLGVPVLRSELLAGVCLFVYGIGNGLISPFQKNVLTRNAPADLRSGVVALDRVVQQVAKTLSPALMGAVLIVAQAGAIFWALGLLSLASVALAALLLRPRWTGIEVVQAS
jgi:predicted MFS family arabinose efflux permease